MQDVAGSVKLARDGPAGPVTRRAGRTGAPSAPARPGAAPSSSSRSAPHTTAGWWVQRQSHKLCGTLGFVRGSLAASKPEQNRRLQLAHRSGRRQLDGGGCRRATEGPWLPSRPRTCGLNRVDLVSPTRAEGRIRHFRTQVLL